MKQTTVVKWGNLKVGALLIFAIAVMFYVSFSGGGTSIFDKKGKFVVYFKNVNGLVAGAPVWMAGVEVGNVKSLKFVNIDSLKQVELVCRIKKSVWHMLTVDTKVQLGTIGVLGDKYVEILPGTFGLAVIEEMDELQVMDAGDVASMFKAGEKALSETGSVISHFDSLLARVNRGEGTLGKVATDEKLYANMTLLMSSLTELTNRLHVNQEIITKSIEKTANSVSSLSDKVDKNQGTIGLLFNDPKLYDNLNQTSLKLDSMLYKINNSEGTLGMMVNDSAIYVETVFLLNRMNNLITDMENNPKKYFKFSLF